MPATPTRLLRAAGLVALASLTLIACGSGATGTQPPGPQATATGGATEGAGGGPTRQPGGGGTVDACALLTADDIKAVTGYTVSSATAGPQAGIFASGCVWELTAPNELVPPSIVLGIMTEGGKAYYDTYFAPYNEEQDFTPIAGLGDTAVDAGASAVLVVKGDVFFNLQYLGEQKLEVELARKVVANL